MDGLMDGLLTAAKKPEMGAGERPAGFYSFMFSSIYQDSMERHKQWGSRCEIS